MIKVCHVIFKHRPFDGRVFQKEIQSLRRAGYEMTVVVPQLNGTSLGRRKEISIETRQSEYRFNGVRFIPFRYMRKMTRKFNLRHTMCRNSLVRALKKARADVYHFHEDGICLEVAAGLKTFLPQAKLVFDFHESFRHQYQDLERPPGFIREYTGQEKKMLAAADLIITVSDFISNIYRQQVTVPVKTIMNCQSESIFNPRENKLADDPHFWLVHEGVLGFDRGLDFIMEMARHINRPDIKFLFIGGFKKDGKKFFDEQVQRYAMREKFLCTGMLPYGEVADYLCAGNVGLDFRTTANAQTGIANKFFNYLRFGIPVVAFPNASTDTIINGNQLGCIVDRDKPQEAARLVENLCENPARLAQISENATRAFKEKYNWELMAARLVKAYKEMLGT